MKQKVYKTVSLQKITKLCELTQANHWLTIVQGESSYGKTFSYRYYSLKNKNVFNIEVQSTESRATLKLWRRLAIQVLGEDFYYKNCEKASFSQLIDYLVFGLNSKKEPNLIVLDEGGFLNYSNLRHLRSLTDRTKISTGYILSGPEYFVKKFKTWIEEEVEGMSELETRTDLIATILAPTSDDKEYICRKEGIESKELIAKISQKSHDFRSLFREIAFYKKGIKSRYVNEWTT